LIWNVGVNTPSGASARTGDPMASGRNSDTVVEDHDEEDAPKAQPKAALKAVTKTTDESKSTESRANDILSMIRNRNKQ